MIRLMAFVLVLLCAAIGLVGFEGARNYYYCGDVAEYRACVRALDAAR